MMKEKILQKLNDVSGEPGLFTDVRFGVRPLPKQESIVEEKPVSAENEERKELSIREIAERRLAKWKDEGRN